MGDNDYTIPGAKKVQDALKMLPTKLQSQIVKGFVSKAGRKFVVKPLKDALDYSKELEKNIKIIDAGQKVVSIVAGVGRKGYKINWVDRGTSERRTKSGANRGRIVGRNQIQPIIKKQIEPLIKFTQDEYENEINIILERRLKKLHK